jgi:hypothetical protein
VIPLGHRGYRRCVVDSLENRGVQHRKSAAPLDPDVEHRAVACDLESDRTLSLLLFLLRGVWIALVLADAAAYALEVIIARAREVAIADVTTSGAGDA